FAYLDAQSRPFYSLSASWLSRLNEIYSLILPLAWWYLIAMVVQAEPLLGEHQFWITRPYSRRSLLAAKILFVLVFLNLPMLLADWVIVSAHGFTPSSYLPGFLFRQLLLLFVWFLPFVALATVTANLGQFLLIPMLYVIAAFVARLPVSLNSWYLAEWIPNSALILVAVVAAFLILRIQYLHRRTVLARGIAIGALPLALAAPSLFPRSTAYALQLALSDRQEPRTSVVLALDRSRRGGHPFLTDSEPGRLEFDFPLRATGIPQDLDLGADHLEVNVRTADGKSWSTPGRSVLDVDGDGQLWMKFHVDKAVFEELKSQRVTLRTSA